MKVENSDKIRINDLNFIRDLELEFIPSIKELIEKENSHMDSLVKSKNKLSNKNSFLFNIKLFSPIGISEFDLNSINQMINNCDYHIGMFNHRLQEYIKYVEDKKKTYFPITLLIKEPHVKTFMYTFDSNVENVDLWIKHPNYELNRKCDYSNDLFLENDLVFSLKVTNITK